jgi:hypothetical protein
MQLRTLRWQKSLGSFLEDDVILHPQVIEKEAGASQRGVERFLLIRQPPSHPDLLRLIIIDPRGVNAAVLHLARLPQPLTAKKLGQII